MTVTAPHHPPRWIPRTIAIVVVLLVGLLPSPLSVTAWSSVPSAALFVGAIAALVLRSRYPRSTAIAAVLLCLAAMPLTGAIAAHAITVLICVFTAARLTDRRTTLIITAFAALVLTSGILFILDSPWQDTRVVFQTTAFVCAAAAIGDATRSRHAFIEAITERARRAEETKEAEASRRVAEERLRIARDLHDVLAHQIAVINLHSSVASQALRDRPDDAEKSLVAVRQAARTVLGEIGSLLSVLRAGDTDASAAAGAPVPGLSELPALIESFERDGLRIDLREAGTPTELPGEVDIVAYRVVQEALTNAHKHGSDHTALLHLEHAVTEQGENQLRITVTNTVDGPATTGGGHGLIGVRERVSFVGGTLAVGRGPGPVHRFEVTLPLPSPRVIPLHKVVDDSTITLEGTP